MTFDTDRTLIAPCEAADLYSPPADLYGVCPCCWDTSSAYRNDGKCDDCGEHDDRDEIAAMELHWSYVRNVNAAGV